MSRRRVSDEEAALWRSVTKTVAPLRRHRKPAAPAEEIVEPKRTAASRAPSPHPVAVTAKAAPKPRQPALAPIDRRSKQKLARGTRTIDARIDLHGRTQAEAHAALRRFLQSQQADGAQTVLVITGKGGSKGEGGVLRRQVPMWLSLPEFRGLVVGFGEAAIGHGGAGALYVRVRRPR
jgi:DNA-nicking Smr family endonuclease